MRHFYGPVIAGTAIGALFATTGASAQQDEWNATIARAKGQPLAIIVHAQDGYAQLVDEFKKEFPDIKVEMTQLTAAPAASRIVTEQKSGIYAWDVWWAAVANMVSTLAPAGAMAPITDYFILPEVRDESNWNATEYLYPAGAKPFVFVHTYQQDTNIYQNLSVPRSKPITKPEDLLDPIFKGQVAIRDATGLNGGTLALAGLMRENGAGYVQRLLNEIQPVSIENPRQLIDSVIRGDKMVAIGADNGIYSQCIAQGACKDLKPLPMGKFVTTRGVTVLKNAPHKDTTKVWINWLLSKKGQETWIRVYSQYWDSGASSLRKDVPPHPKHLASVPDYATLGRFTLTVDASGQDITDKVITMYKEYRAKN